MADWQAGDLALCIKSDRFGNDTTREGCVYDVVGVKTRSLALDGQLSTALQLARAPHRLAGSDARRFIKVTPSEADEFDRETIALSRRTPVPVGTGREG